MRGLNPWTQRLLTAKPRPRGKPPFIPHPAVFNTVSGGMERSRGKPPVYSFFCDYPQRRARDDPKGIPRDGPLVRSRGDPGG